MRLELGLGPELASELRLDLVLLAAAAAVCYLCQHRYESVYAFSVAVCWLRKHASMSTSQAAAVRCLR